ncbi:hypothetical protein QTQ03_25440 [Micromonospora sp. WMMA1363]|uniref:hypothetical protein n=1 Tax=Micromonospora sp. WMMA1363 TaxID=3053985 RepID=UPI00259CD941|nr:hypothetical protein [Micromonospora sp. WMMA1363]MDM4722780.1 hypothetical protein [Micromonospora sp. WMMA1363]
MTATLRDQIVAIVSPHTSDCPDADCGTCDDAAHRADLILTALADWLTEPGHDWRLGLALAEAGGADGFDADRAVTALLTELGDTIRPTPVGETRPGLADRYATLRGRD